MSRSTSGPVRAPVEGLRHGRHVEPELLRVSVEVGAFQLRLIREQEIVHLPELP